MAKNKRNIGTKATIRFNTDFVLTEGSNENQILEAMDTMDRESLAKGDELTLIATYDQIYGGSILHVFELHNTRLVIAYGHDSKFFKWL